MPSSVHPGDFRLDGALLESSDTRTATRGAVVFSILLFSALSIWAAIASTGFLEADACTHYLYSRFALHERHLLTNVWGRPFCTALYALPAFVFGRTGVRLTSLFLALAVAWITHRIARKQHYRRPSLALIFLLAQPLVFLHSFSELTELPFVLLLALAFWGYQNQRWTWFALLSGLMPTARPEGFAFLALALLALLAHRRFRPIPLLALPLLLWSFAGWAEFGYSRPWYVKLFTWLPENWPYADRSLYTPGHLLHFLGLLPAAVSPLLFPAALIGIWRSAVADGAVTLARGIKDGDRFISLTAVRWDHRTQCQWLIAVLPLLVLLGHSLLYWAGRMASSGEWRYLLVVAPFWALLAAKGWEWIFDRCRFQRVWLWAVVAAFLPYSVNWVYKVVPLQLTRDWVRSGIVAQWMKQNPWQENYPKLTATHTGFFYFMDVSPTDWSRSVEWGPKALASPPDGTVAIWDPIYGRYNADSTRAISAEQMKENGWVPVKVFPREVKAEEGTGPVARLAQAIQSDEVGEWVVFLSPRDAQGRATSRELAVPLPSTAPATQP